MNTNILKLMFAVCAVLSGVLMLEWIFAGSDEPVAPIAVNSDDDKDFDVDLPEIKSSGKTREMFADMVDRPLFIDGRRPVVEDEEPAGQVEESKIDDLTLMGVFVQGDQSTAMFEVKGDKKQYAKKTLNDEVSGWLVQEILADKVILERDGVTETLKLRKPKLNKPNAKANGKAPALKRSAPPSPTNK